MENEVVIDVQNVEKSFRVYKDKGYTLKSKILFSNRRAYEDRKVLRGISFQVRRGEAIGLIGHNGCGKSTTLKLLSRIIYPDKGKITMKGRVSSLIELGAGFHPDMTGRENIYINASIFGLNREEIDRRLGEIIDFSELGEFIDTPVRTYSSGMYMRLAFSVAINVDADILLIDEILAVGDAAFQAKCFNKLRDIKCNGTTIVIVSHSLGQIEQICERSYWIDKGLVREYGAPYDVHQDYMRHMSSNRETLDNQPRLASEELAETPQDMPMEEASQEVPQEEQNELRWGSRDVILNKIIIRDENGKETNRFECGKPMKIELYFQQMKDVEDFAFGIGIFRNDGVHCYGINTDLDNIRMHRLDKKASKVVFLTDCLNLLEGEYTLDVAIHRPDGFAYDYWRKCANFSVWSAIKDAGIMRITHQWSIE